MSRYAIITNGIVTNIVTQNIAPPDDFYFVVTDTAQIGWMYDEVNFIAPTSSITIPSKSQIWEKIKQKRDDLQLNGGVKVGLNWFLTTERAVGEYTALALISTGLPDTTILRAGWRTMNGSLIDMTPLLVKQILTAGFTQIAAIDTISQNHKAAMELSSTPETYDFSAGWPEVYIP
jgi:hypothetical protein